VAREYQCIVFTTVVSRKNRTKSDRMYGIENGVSWSEPARW
jgi:hypothetical protein